MKYTIEYHAVTEIEKWIGVEDDFAENALQVKNLVKNATHPIKSITKNYADGRGVDVTEKYIKSIDLCDVVCK